jgi:uncharacterized protein YoxC
MRMPAIVQKNLSVIITVITFIFTAGIVYAKLEYTNSALNQYINMTQSLQKEVVRIDKETATILKDLQYIKEGIQEIKGKL